MGTALVTLNTEADRRLVAKWAVEAPEGTRVSFKGARRSVRANDKMWALLTDVSRQVEWYGQHLTPSDWKDVFSASLRKARVVPGIDPGTFVPLGMRTSDMPKEDFGMLLDLIQAFGAERGVVWSEPVKDEAA